MKVRFNLRGIQQPGHEVGLLDLDRERAAQINPGIEPGYVSAGFGVQWHWDLEVPESTARRAGERFALEGDVVVALSAEVAAGFVIHRYEPDTPLHRGYWAHAYDGGALLAAWEAASFPLQWGEPTEEEAEDVEIDEEEV